jgi:hypothetical protein
MKKKPFVLRLSDDMFKELEQWSAAEFRSVNGQIEFILHRAIMERKKNSAAAAKSDNKNK